MICSSDSRGIGRVQHRANAGHGEEQLEVAMGIPGQRRHQVAGLHPQLA
jgi:hypothetical protein